MRVPFGYTRTICVLLCLIKSIMPCLSSLFAVFSDSEKTCSGAYTSFLLIPRHLTPTVYTSSATRSIDIFTFGFTFRPWKGTQALADGPGILQYVEDTAAEFGIDQRIRYGVKVVAADFDTGTGRWTPARTPSSPPTPWS